MFCIIYVNEKEVQLKVLNNNGITLNRCDKEKHMTSFAFSYINIAL